MDKTLALQAEVREGTGSKAAAAVRRQGRIPAIVYGHKEAPVAISLDAHDFVEGLHHGHRLLDLTVAGNTSKMIIKDVQYDHLGRDVLHADLMRVDEKERITVSVPLEVKGTPKGAHEGGILEVLVNQLDIECLVVDIPKSIVVPVKDLDVGQVIHTGAIKLPEGAKLMMSPDTIAISCRVLAEVKTTEQIEAETPAAPEVIREREPKAEEGATEEPKGR